MQPTQELIDVIYIEKVRRARQAPPGEKLFVGAELFEMRTSGPRPAFAISFPKPAKSRRW